MLRLVEEHKTSNESDVLAVVVDGLPLDAKQVRLLIQLKGQILAFETVLKMKDFLNELTEEQNEVQSNRTENFN